eukprot:15330158-Ditylum_brightwellii.AAC.1
MEGLQGGHRVSVAIPVPFADKGFTLAESRGGNITDEDICYYIAQVDEFLTIFCDCNNFCLAYTESSLFLALTRP